MAERTKKNRMLLLCGLLSLCLPFSSSAASPSFARTEEEWQKLEDNLLEYEEIPDLVAEYNASVRKAEAEYSSSELKGRNAESTSNALLRMADEYEALAVEAESVTGGGVTAAAYRLQEENLRSQADENVSDYRTLLYENDRLALSVESEACSLFYDYYEAIEAKDLCEKKVAYLERAYQSASNLEKYGMGTAVETLTALESLQKAKAELVTKDGEISAAYKKLITLCGWKYDSEAEIGAEPEGEALSVITDRDADLQTALKESITLKEDAVSLANAKDLYGAGTVSKWELQTESDTNTVKDSFTSAYNALMSAEDACESALSKEAVQLSNLTKAGKELSLGTISQMEFVTAKYNYECAVSAARTAKRTLARKRLAYDLLLKGLS